MITLYAFGPAFGLPDASPFVTKADVLLKMLGQPYRLETGTQGLRKAPKGKLTYNEDDGLIVADSTSIRWHLERKYEFDFDEGLDELERATAWAVEKLLEDNLYWIGVRTRWLNEANFAKVSDQFFRTVPWPLRRALEAFVQGRVRQSLRAQGMGRQSEDQMRAIGVKGLWSLSTLLGDKPYLMGDRPCGADAMFYASVASALCPQFKGPLRVEAQAHANLVAYEARMRQRYYPQL